MTTETHAVEYGSRKLQFTLRRRKRKTLAIHVHPDMSIEVVARRTRRSRRSTKRY